MANLTDDINERIRQYSASKGFDIGKISDGYNTFDELYMIIRHAIDLIELHRTCKTFHCEGLNELMNVLSKTQFPTK